MKTDYAVGLLQSRHEQLQEDASKAEEKANAAWKAHRRLVEQLESVRDALFALGTDPDASDGCVRTPELQP